VTCLSCKHVFILSGRRRRSFWRICITSRCSWGTSISWRLWATLRRFCQCCAIARLVVLEIQVLVSRCLISGIFKVLFSVLNFRILILILKINSSVQCGLIIREYIEKYDADKNEQIQNYTQIVAGCLLKWWVKYCIKWNLLVYLYIVRRFLVLVLVLNCKVLDLVLKLRDFVSVLVLNLVLFLDL